MKKLLRRTAVSILLSTPLFSAKAADMPLKAAPPPPPAPAISWTGYYVGVNIGYGIGDDPTTESTVSGAAFPILTPGTPIYGAPRVYSIDPKGVIGGWTDRL
jgi:hypothetical protein